MCGIVGVITSDYTQEDKEVFADLVYFDTLRGEDSTGVLAINQDNKFLIRKEVLPGWHFLDLKQVTEDLRPYGNEWRFLIGHNRKATVGKVTRETAHPFLNEHISLVHNGTLSGDWRSKGKGETDSMVITEVLAKQGTKGLADLQGAMALVWYDFNTKTINFARNDQRPDC